MFHVGDCFSKLMKSWLSFRLYFFTDSIEEKMKCQSRWPKNKQFVSLVSEIQQSPMNLFPKESPRYRKNKHVYIFESLTLGLFIVPIACKIAAIICWQVQLCPNSKKKSNQGVSLLKLNVNTLSLWKPCKERVVVVSAPRDSLTRKGHVLTSWLIAVCGQNMYPFIIVSSRTIYLIKVF